MHAALLVLLLPVVSAQAPAPHFLYVYRDSLKAGVDSAYGAIENDGAQVCADRKCPNPYFALESVSGPHEAWWINAFATEADTARVAHAYASNHELAGALAGIAGRKEALIGRPIQGFAVYRAELSRGPVWSVVGARFIVVAVTRTRRPVRASVWEMADSTLYILRTAKTLHEATAIAGELHGRIFAIRPQWSMPDRAWVSADSEFWRTAPVAR